MSTLPKPQGKTTYVASRLDWDWLLSEQRKLYKRSWEKPDYVFDKLWGLVTDARNLRLAVGRVARNKGARTAGVDGFTVRKVLRRGGDAFVAGLRAELRSGNYRPSPVRRVLISKAGQPGKFRPLGIPTVKDRVVQAAVKNVLEPIFEADFFPTSHGFRMGKSVHGALDHVRRFMRPVPPSRGSKERRPHYQWAIEGDIKGCFDHINHHALMVRLRRRVGDSKVSRLVLVFLKAGILSEEQFLRSEAGTPQGGILSPLLANIALSALDERYERHVWSRRKPKLQTVPALVEGRAANCRWNDRRRGKVVMVPIRYADDFLILVGAPFGPEEQERARAAATHEKAELATFLREQLGLELSEQKTLVTPVTAPIRFLGHHLRVRHRHPAQGGGLVSTTVIPKDRSHRLRERIKDLFRSGTTRKSLADRLQILNPMLRGWCNFYRHAWLASRVFSKLDHYVWWTIFRWLRKKHERVRAKALMRQYGQRRRPGGPFSRWNDRGVVVFEASTVRVEKFLVSWLNPPNFVKSMESPVHSERCTPGSAGGSRKPPGASQVRRREPT
jgi:group II intron reverse transcriptase/maturase